jgi:hypothetical protein
MIGAWDRWIAAAFCSREYLIAEESYAVCQ